MLQGGRRATGDEYSAVLGSLMDWIHTVRVFLSLSLSVGGWCVMRRLYCVNFAKSRKHVIPIDNRSLGCRRMFLLLFSVLVDRSVPLLVPASQTDREICLHVLHQMISEGAIFVKFGDRFIELERIFRVDETFDCRRFLSSQLECVGSNVLDKQRRKEALHLCFPKNSFYSSSCCWFSHLAIYAGVLFTMPQVVYQDLSTTIG